MNPVTVHLFKCELCSFVTVDQVLLTDHFKCHRTKVTGFQCGFCSYVSIYENDVMSHQKKCALFDRNWSRAVGYECNDCKDLLYHNNLMLHVAGKHKANIYACRKCSYIGNKEGDLQQHQRAKHRLCLTLSCPICKKFVANTEIKIISHVMERHFIKKAIFKCVYCIYFNVDKNIEHINNRHYACLFCYTVLVNPYELFSHYISEHFPSLKFYYSCTDCNSAFSKENSLYQHKRGKHGIDDDEYEAKSINIACKFCPFNTYLKTNYYQHVKDEHQNFIDYNCPFKDCSYQTLYFYSLTQHITDKHLSYKVTYTKCTDCDDMFKKKFSLIQHLNDKHDIDFCTLCNYRYEDLEDHIDYEHTDLNETYLKCLLCDEECKDLSELDEHLEDDHSLIIPEELREVI